MITAEERCTELEEIKRALQREVGQLRDDLEGVRLINKLQAEEIAEQRHTLRQWLAANAPGGWIYDLRKASQSDAAGEQT